MESYQKIFMRKLLEHKDNLSEYINELYSDESRENDLNALFAELKKEGLVNCIYADNRAYIVSLTSKGKNIKESELRLTDKEELVNLSDRIDEIQKLFHPAPDPFNSINEIHDINEFNQWRDEVTFILQKIHDRTHDTSIWRAINQFKVNLNGYNDENEVNQMFSVLRTVVKRIDDYFPDQEKENKKVNSTTLKQYDVFISHANKDKLEYVEELYQTISKLGIKVFYDRETFEWGDNWKQKIYDGVATSEFAIIVISDNYFGREWTEKELQSFLNKQNASGEKTILPLLHGISISDLCSHYPELGEIQAISDEKYDIKDVTILFARQLLKRYKGD